MITRDQVSLRIRNILSIAFKINAQFEMTDKVSNHLDSMELIQLVIGCEEEFKIKISNETVEGIETFDHLITAIQYQTT